MKNRNPFCVSPTLMKEIFKMYWHIPAATFVLYFFSGIMPILSNISNVDSINYYIRDTMRNINLMYTCIICITPIITAVLMMGFLHKGSKALMIHIQPFSKNRIFNSYYLSGWLMCIIPLLLMSLSYTLLSFKIHRLVGIDIMFWLLSSIAIMTWFYGITVLAGTLTGTALMNLLSAGTLMIIFPVMISISGYYCSIFMNGYCKMPGLMAYIEENYNPVLNMLFRYEADGVKALVMYFVIGVLLSFLAKRIYKTRKLERIGSSTLSKGFEELMTYLVVFVGMSLFGLMMWTFSSSKPLIIAGMLIGMLLTFSVVKIIVNRTVRIFDKRFARSLGIYLIIAAVFVALVIFDITGFSKRVPAESDIKSVEMEDFAVGYDVFAEYRFASDENVNSKRQFSSPESINKIAELHRYIIDEDLCGESSGGGTEVKGLDGESVIVGNEYIHIKYRLKDGRMLERLYDVNMDEKAAQMLDDLITGEEFREKNSLSSYINMENISYIQITGLTDEYYDSYYDYYESYDYGYDGHHSYKDRYEEHVLNSGNIAVVENPKLIKKIFDAWDEDMRNCGYLENNRGVTELYEVASIEVFFKESKTPKNGKGKGKKKPVEESVTFMVSNFDGNTISCLTDAGYGFTIGKASE